MTVIVNRKWKLFTAIFLVSSTGSVIDLEEARVE